MLWLDVGRTDKGSRADTRVSIVRKIDKHPCQWLDNGMSNVLTDTKIANSLYCHIYIRWLQNDWSVRECSRKAKELFNENISYEAFRQYKLAMSSDEIVPDLFAKHIGNQDLDINEEKILMQQIIILKQRIFKA
ncbi:MAG: hypothetical protein ACRDFB_05100, partial [Rhabdochlamydiaceae bacterium]